MTKRENNTDPKSQPNFESFDWLENLKVRDFLAGFERRRGHRRVELYQYNPSIYGLSERVKDLWLDYRVKGFSVAKIYWQDPTGRVHLQRPEEDGTFSLSPKYWTMIVETKDGRELRCKGETFLDFRVPHRLVDTMRYYAKSAEIFVPLIARFGDQVAGEAVLGGKPGYFCGVLHLSDIREVHHDESIQEYFDQGLVLTAPPTPEDVPDGNLG